MRQFVTALLMVGCLSFAGVVGAAGPPAIPQPATEEERLAELGVFLTAWDASGESKCLSSWDGKPETGGTALLCQRNNERITLWRERHAKLCTTLKVQGGKYGCKP